MEKIFVNGINLAYVRQGNGAPLVLLHGYPLDHSIWEAVTALLNNTFEILAPDLRGFGESDAPKSSYTMADMAADIEGLLNALEIQKAYVVGHSMGGYVALAFARAYPERVFGLGLVSSQALPDTPERKAGRYATAQQVLEQGVGIVTGMSEKLAANSEWIPHLYSLIAKQNPQGIAGALRAMAERVDSTDLLPKLDFPVVLVHGDTDALIPVERAREIKTVKPQAHLVQIPGTGHMPMLENPQETADALSWFTEN